MATVIVTGRFEHPDNSAPCQGELIWQLAPGDVPDLSEPVTVLGGPVRALLHSDGSFKVELRATDDPALTAHVTGNLVYRVTRNIDNLRTFYTVAVPLPGPWDWAELTPVPNSDAAVVPVPGPVGPMGPVGPQGPQGIQGPIGPQGVWTQLTQAQYDALGTKDPLILYVIVG